MGRWGSCSTRVSVAPVADVASCFDLGRLTESLNQDLSPACSLGLEWLGEDGGLEEGSLRVMSRRWIARNKAG